MMLKLRAKDWIAVARLKKRMRKEHQDALHLNGINVPFALTEED